MAQEIGVRPIDLPVVEELVETDKIMVTHEDGQTEVATSQTFFKNGSKTICLTRAEYDELEEKGEIKEDALYIITDEDAGGLAVDQEYNPKSANPQSGTAVASALNSALANYEPNLISAETYMGYILNYNGQNRVYIPLERNFGIDYDIAISYLDIAGVIVLNPINVITNSNSLLVQVSQDISGYTNRICNISLSFVKK